MAERTTSVVVSVGGADVLAGTLYSHRRQNNESASFIYDESYLRHPEAYPLDPTLPLALYMQQTPDGLSMFRAFSDAAPDRWGRTLIKRRERRVAEATGRASRSFGEIDFLLGVRDDLRQGALRFRDPDSGVYLAGDLDGIPIVTELSTLLDMAANVERNTATDQEIETLLRVGSSLGGARPKAHVIDENGRVAIAKFPSAGHDTWNVMAWEYIALRLAAQAAIVVPDVSFASTAAAS
jgi:serine/threonine-protein kinase HipA